MPAGITGDTAAVILCSDVVAGDYPLSLGELSATLYQQGSHARVLVAEHLCNRPAALGSAVQVVGANRVVVACRRLDMRREQILQALSTAGIHPSARWLVDLAWDEESERAKVGAEAVALVRAALARVARADLAAPVHERTGIIPSGVSRRDLFHFGPLRRRPVVAWIDGGCGAGSLCRACAAACPHGALAVGADGVAVMAAKCTGCGLCITSCPRSALVLPGASLADLEAAGSALAEDARRLGSGIAIVCTDSPARLPLGRGWLPFEVPSLEMVTAGWLLQLLAAGIDVSMVACGDEACAARGKQLTSFCAALAEVVSPCCSSSRPAPPAPLAPSVRTPGVVALPGWSRNDVGHPPLELREPDATVRAVASATGRLASFRIESPVAPLGELSVDAPRCSACGCCVSVCPTAALERDDERAAFRLSFTASRCTACAVCVAACPEGVLSLRRVLDDGSDSGGRVLLARVLAAPRCDSCGEPIAAGLGGIGPGAVAERLAASHPAIAARLREGRYCADCRLLARSPSVARSLPEPLDDDAVVAR